jgi:hypothetical protein
MKTGNSISEKKDGKVIKNVEKLAKMSQKTKVIHRHPFNEGHNNERNTKKNMKKSMKANPQLNMKTKISTRNKNLNEALDPI